MRVLVFLFCLTLYGPMGIVPIESADDLSAVLALAKKLDNALDEVSPETFPTFASNDDLMGWKQEITPYFAMEGITDGSRPDSGLVYPEVAFSSFADPQGFFHFLATTNFLPPHTITLSDRILNPASAWFQRKDTVLVLIHELCHAQGILIGYDDWSQWDLSYDIEVSASLCALEVAAAMVASGNQAVRGPLLFQLRGMAIGAAEAIAIRENRLDDYQAAIERMLTPTEQSSRDKNRRMWTDGPVDYEAFLHSYCAAPIEMLIEALNSDNVIDGLLLPINQVADSLNHPYEWSPYGYPTVPIEPVKRTPIRGLLLTISTT